MTEAGLWPRIEPLLGKVERPARYVNREWGARHASDAEYRAALIYPDTYEIGQANQAIAILYAALNSLPGVSAERAYLPWLDMITLMRETEVPLFSLESCSAIREFDLVGITIPYELTYSNILEALNLAGIPIRAVDRAESDPLVVGGGPCVFNPEPVAPFFDAILIGEGEEAVGDIVSVHRSAKAAGLSRIETLSRHVPDSGVYVPSLYEVRYEPDGSFGAVTPVGDAPGRVTKRVVADLDVPPGAGRAHRSVHGCGARPFWRRGAARLHARLPVLPGGNGLPPGP